MDIAIDFDGTCVSHEFPEIGKDIGAAMVLKELIDNGHRLILFTMRSDSKEDQITGRIASLGLTNAINWFNENNIPLYGVNCNPTQRSWTESPKAYAQLYIDDAALGIPLITDGISRPYVNWAEVRRMLVNRNIIDDSSLDTTQNN